jgi:hypothetical protein
VEIPALTPEPTTSLPTVLALTLTHHGSDGRRVLIQGELDAAHWRWALELLEAGP